MTVRRRVLMYEHAAARCARVLDEAAVEAEEASG
jgi:hypothetical protein